LIVSAEWTKTNEADKVEEHSKLELVCY